MGLSNRVVDSTVIFGDDFTANNYELLSRLAEAVKEIRLTGKAGLKFYMMKHNLDKLGNISLGTA